MTYALITPARNEARYIEATIKGVVGQSRRPARWVIVSDGSTDGTDEIVRAYAARHHWIELVRTSERRERHFAAKVEAFNTGYARLAGLDCDVIGNLDADVSIDDPDYFDFLIGQFETNTRLGIVGSAYLEGDAVYPYRYASLEDVFGACQLFRRRCFEAIGGYPALRAGGIDVVVVLKAQAEGWQTRTFTEKVCVHHRPVGSAHCVNTCRRLFQTGMKDYSLGSHPAIVVLRSFNQMAAAPFVGGGLLVIAGYLWAFLSRLERAIPCELVKLRQGDQLRRLRATVRRSLSFSA